VELGNFCYLTTHLGQALVRFHFVFYQDNLVTLGPKQALGFTITVICHDEGWNLELQ
jgi:hypothetical protein